MSQPKVDFKHPEDNWYKYKGVQPPQHFYHGMTVDEVSDKIDEVHQKHTCQWVQRGVDLICEVGANRHGHRVGPDKKLVGTENGKPILRDVVVSKQTQ